LNGSGNAIGVEKINGIPALIYTRFNRDWFFRFELNSQVLEPLEVRMDIVHHKRPVTDAGAVGIQRYRLPARMNIFHQLNVMTEWNGFANAIAPLLDRVP
jgi:hypothetical protein